MPYPYQDCFSCPVCGDKICIPIGMVSETYLCPNCDSVIHVHIWADANTKDPAPIDARHIC